MSETLIKPGVSLGNYPQRQDDALDDLEAVVRHWGERVRARLCRKACSQGFVTRRIKRYEETLRAYSEQELDAAIDELRWQLHQQGMQQEFLLCRRL